MSPATPPEKASEGRRTQKQVFSMFPKLFDVAAASNLAWLPYQTMCGLLVSNHKNLKAAVSLNRKLGDEMRDALRSQQNLALEMSERLLNFVADSTARRPVSSQYRESFDHLQDATLTAMREIGAAVTAAQLESLETFKQQIHLDQKTDPNGHGREETAH